MQKISLFGIHIDPLTMVQSVAQVLAWHQANEKTCHFVVTPNVDHLVQLETNAKLQSAYDQAALVLVDGKPVRWALGLLKQPIPETVPGSDLVPEIFMAAQTQQQHLSVFLLGAMPGVAEKAKTKIETQWPNVRVVGTLSPDYGFERDHAACEKICDAINASGASLLILGLGAPKQEIWVTQYAAKLKVNGALCVGATIDFLAGEKSRAPKWVRALCLEWLYRMLLEPHRLIKRYAKDAFFFPQIIYKAWRNKR